MSVGEAPRWCTFDCLRKVALGNRKRVERVVGPKDLVPVITQTGPDFGTQARKNVGNPWMPTITLMS